MKPTPRQIEVLEAIVITGNIMRAAARLGISYHTVRTHLDVMHRRIGLTTEQAIADGLTKGWLVVRDPIQRRAFQSKRTIAARS